MSILLWPEGAPYAKGNEPEDCPSITPYLLDKDKTQPSPCMIVCPGGGYYHHAINEQEPIARWLNEIGISAVVLKYRVAPYRHPCPYLDAQRAIRLVRSRAQEWNIDPQRIGIIGFSASGHLAAHIGTRYDNGLPDAEDPIDRESSRPDLMVLCYAAISMIEYSHNKYLLGEEASEEVRFYLSSEKHVTPDTPPAFIWTTVEDQFVPVEHSLLFTAALSKNRIPFELHIFESGKHGLGMAKDNPSVKTWTLLCELWLKKHGFNPSGQFVQLE